MKAKAAQGSVQKYMGHMARITVISEGAHFFDVLQLSLLGHTYNHLS